MTQRSEQAWCQTWPTSKNKAHKYSHFLQRKHFPLIKKSTFDIRHVQVLPFSLRNQYLIQKTTSTAVTLSSISGASCLGYVCMRVKPRGAGCLELSSPRCVLAWSTFGSGNERDRSQGDGWESRNQFPSLAECVQTEPIASRLWSQLSSRRATSRLASHLRHHKASTYKPSIRHCKSGNDLVKTWEVLNALRKL